MLRARFSHAPAKSPACRASAVRALPMPASSSPDAGSIRASCTYPSAPKRSAFPATCYRVFAGLDNVADETFLAPRVVRLARQKRLDRKCAAMNFAAFDRQIDLRPAGITLYEVELRPDQFLE